MNRFNPYNLRNKESNMNNPNNSHDNQNPIPTPPPQPLPPIFPSQSNPLPSQRTNDETNRLFEKAERIMKALQTPQSINSLQPFDGNPVKLHGFLRSVEHFMPFLEPMKDTPFEKVWLQAIRAKIINEADQVLETYGTSLNWDEIKSNLIAHYNDKRDQVTLTRELFQLQQSSRSIEQFFEQTQHLLSLLINNTNISIADENVRKDRNNTHKEYALQVFLAGLNEPIGGNVRARQPGTIKQAFDAAVEERNFRSRAGLAKSVPARPPKPIDFPQNYASTAQYSQQQRNPHQHPRGPQPNPQNASNHNNGTLRPPQRALPAPESTNKSIQSKQVNYINRPQQSSNNNYRKPHSHNSRYAPAVPPRSAQITELQNMEQDYDDEQPSTSNDYQYETPHTEMENYPDQDYAASQASDLNPRENTPQESMDYLNFQIEITPNFHR